MNPVQFKVSSVENTVKKEVEGMTVFNTEQVNTKKQPMFFGKPLGVQRYDSFKYPVFDKSPKFTDLRSPSLRQTSTAAVLSSRR